MRASVASSVAVPRCGGEDFVAALIFTAAGLPTWSRDPKRTLLAALCGNVAHEAHTVRYSIV